MMLEFVSEMKSVNLEQQEGVVESSPRGVLEDCTISLEYETPSKDSTNSLEPETASRASTSGSEVAIHWREFFRGLRKGAARRIQTFPPPKKHAPKLTRSKTKRIREELIPVISTPLETDLYCLKSSWRNFALSEIKNATSNFSPGTYLNSAIFDV